MAEGMSLGKPMQVLVTGASGYIATHIVKQLLELGSKVRGTMRTTKDEAKKAALYKLCPEAESNLEIVEADLLKAETWIPAVSGCTYVIHVASPFPAQNPSDENELIKPAVDGTLNVLKACREARTVERVVLTSSVAAVSGGFDVGGDKTFTEEDWTDDQAPKIMPYVKSKTLAEKAAWDYIKGLPDGEKFQMAVINPAYVMGPVLCGGFTTSMELPKRILERAMPMIPRINFTVTDVRDVAAAHIAAMTNPEAAGKRHIVCGQSYWFKEIATILDEEFREQGYNVPTRVCPDWLLSVFSWFDPTVRMIKPSLGKVTKVSNDRMLQVLKISPRDGKNTILDMAYSMIDADMIKKTSRYQPRAPKSQNAQ